MINLTEQEIKQLKEASNESQWNSACDGVKNARGGSYPDDWYSVVIIGGILGEAQSKWS